MFWLNAVARANMRDISVTWLVFQADMSWLNAAASSNIDDISVTWLVVHPDMSWLNSSFCLNICCILVTWLVSHWPIARLPAAPQSTVDKEQLQAPVGSAVRQLFTAACKSDPLANGAASTGREEGIKRSAQLNATVTSGKRSVATLGFRSLRRHAGRVRRRAACFTCFGLVFSTLHVPHTSRHTRLGPPAHVHTPVGTAPQWLGASVMAHEHGMTLAAVGPPPR
eukprot:scaffold1353_cov417-Prasinococcus_capsulatus_cf.AAC.2